jgi:membrane associated rhomboid family serine protease
MQQDNTLEIFYYSGALILSLAFLFLAIGPKYRHTSRWLRSVVFVLAIVGPIWSALGFLVLFESEHLTRNTHGYLYQWESHLSGIAFGLLISLFLSPEFRQLCRADRSDQKV